MAPPPKAPQPPALVELPSRQFYTLKEAATELNRLYGRTDIDENYILQLASIGKIAVQWRFTPEDGEVYHLIPHWYDWPENFDAIDFYYLQNHCVGIFENMPFLDLGTYRINELIFEDSLNIDRLFIENCFDAKNQYFLQSPEIVRGFDFKLVCIGSDVKDKFIDMGLLNLSTKLFHSYDSPEFLSDRAREEDERIIFCFKDEAFQHELIKEHLVEIDVYKKDLYVLGYDIDLIKQGKFRNREDLSVMAAKQQETLMARRDSTPQKQERPSDQRRQVLAALRHMAQCNTGQPYKDAEVLLAYAATKGLDMPANVKTIAKHIYPDQNIIDSD
ncbi:hypothetical protein [Alkanindiges illinoisensis]|uniref:Uncharacterized protein n=1 Tax=Alkanindiges illinoisensis TaxID=197183 RepID=A0A4Y7XFS1_9GAMM|nr:hypothetical protein [Alkanindiges illinoisensis]TEU30594.1 hypothetical protein E2B99_00990 [Alkanindiges illinoisensis]